MTVEDIKGLGVIIVAGFVVLLLSMLITLISPFLSIIAFAVLIYYAWKSKDNKFVRIIFCVAAGLLAVSTLFVCTLMPDEIGKFSDGSGSNSGIQGAVDMLNEVKGKSLPDAINTWHDGK